MKSVVLQAARREFFRVRRLARTAEGAGGAEAGVVNEDDQNVGGTFGRAQLLDGWVFRFRVLRVVGDRARTRAIGDG